MPNFLPQLLSPWNQTSLRCYTQQVFCFPFDDSDEKNQALAMSHLKGALRRLAGQRPDFAGVLHLCSRPNVRPGSVCLSLSESREIPLDVEDIRTAFEAPYSQLAAEGFPPAAFVDRRFELKTGIRSVNEEGVHVFRVRAFFIKGGLLLVVAFHHAFSDGDCAAKFVKCLAAQTRNERVDVADDLELRLKEPLAKDGKSEAELLQLCPEYNFWEGDQLLGPTTFIQHTDGTPEADIPAIGKVFVFKTADLDRLIGFLKQSYSNWREPPTRFVALAALTWAHVATARAATETYSRHAHRPLATIGHSRLFNPVSWKSKCTGFNGDEYFGNAAAVPMTEVCSTSLDNATRPAWPVPDNNNNNSSSYNHSHGYGHSHNYSHCNSHCNSNGGNGNFSPNFTSSSSNNDMDTNTDEADRRNSAFGANDDCRPARAPRPKQGLSWLAWQIHTTIRGVDDAFVRKRLALFEGLADPRKLGMDTDPRSPQDLGFNTWNQRQSVADEAWAIPGVVGSGGGGGGGGGDADPSSSSRTAGSKPDAVCRAQASWQIGGALILPGRADADAYRLLVTLPPVSMERLCQDREWRSWVHEVIG